MVKLFLLAFCVLACSTASLAGRVDVAVFAKGFKNPVSLKFDGAGRAYVVEQRGRVKVIDRGHVLREPFLDITEKTTRLLTPSSEQGLLDVALDPGYPNNGRFFTHYTDREGDTVIAVYQAKALKADPNSERVILRQKQPYSNHNGGQIEFGPDGYLYIALGDGGAGGDPHGNAQNLASLLGKILRLDVFGPDSYKIPSSNPLFGRGEAKSQKRAEIWAYGLRNPWRFSFDGNLLYIGDVGQNAWEEINVENIAEGGGKNYGWNLMEGRRCYRRETCPQEGLVLPVHEYPLYQEGDCSVTGGYVYRGKMLPELIGLYFYADYCSGTLRSFRYNKGQATEHKNWNQLNPKKRRWKQISSLARDPQGELYLVDHKQGIIFKLTPGP